MCALNDGLALRMQCVAFTDPAPIADGMLVSKFEGTGLDKNNIRFMCSRVC